MSQTSVCWVSWEQAVPSPIAPSCYAIGRGVARGARCPTAQGFRISISCVLLVIHSLSYTCTGSLFLLVSLPPHCTELGCEQLGEQRGTRVKEGFTRKSQPKPRNGGHSPAEQTHVHAPTTDANLARTATLQSSNSQLFTLLILCPTIDGYGSIQMNYEIHSSTVRIQDVFIIRSVPFRECFLILRIAREGVYIRSEL